MPQAGNVFPILSCVACSKSDKAASIFFGRCSRRHSNSNSPPITVLGERRSPRVADWQISQDYLWLQP
jgi:hypothetical protein